MFQIRVDSLGLILVGTFILDALVLWATGEIIGIKAIRLRIIAAACLSAFAFTVLVIISDLSVFSLISWTSMGLQVATAALSTVLAFGRIRIPLLTKAVLHRYLLTIMAGGAGSLVARIVPHSRMAPFLAAIATVLMVAEAGWGVVHRRIRDGIFLVPVTICFGRDTLLLQALIDTGNRLCDPLSGNPVMIVEYSAIEPILPTEVKRAVVHSEEDFQLACGYVARSAWSSRFRVVPYSSIGRDKGLLMGFRPDTLTVHDGAGDIKTNRVVVCVHGSRLASDGRYRALLNPDILGSD